MFHLNVLIETRQLTEVNKALRLAIEAAVNVIKPDREAAYDLNLWTRSNRPMVDRIINAFLGEE